MLNPSGFVAIAACCLSVSLASTTVADITWNITYSDQANSTGNGFDHAGLGSDRRSTFSQVLNYINTVIDANGVVDLTINNSQTDGGGFLASAGSLYFTGPNGFSNGIVFEHATTGIDPLASNTDGSATFDFGYNWNSQTDATAVGEFDLFTVALHEVTHALGFASLVSSTGVSEISGGDPGVFSVFDSFLELGDGTDLFMPNGDFAGTAADLSSDDLFFNGAAAVAANGGAPVKIFAPGTFQDGSSLSHLDTATFPSSVMTPAISSGVQKRTYSAIDRAVLSDIGYTLKATAVPEPSGALILATIAIAGGLCRHRRTRPLSRTSSVPEARIQRHANC